MLVRDDIAYQEVIEFFKQNSSVQLSLSFEKTKIVTRKNLQHLFSHRFSDKKSQIIFEMILSYVAQAEKRCASAGQLVLQKLCKQSFSNLQLKTKNDVITCLLNLGINTFFIEVMNQLFELSTLDTKVTIKKSTNSNFYLELVEGHNFEVMPLLPQSKQKEYSKANVLCVDGYIESVSEIHHLLEEYTRNKNCLLLFVRGMHEDVLNTLAVNMTRGTLDIHPFKVEFDLDNVNTLVDIASISGGDVLSSNKGDIISSSLKYVMQVDKVSIRTNSIVISTKNKTDIAARLKKKIEERPDLESFLKKRLSSVTSRHVVIAVPDDINFISNSQQLDTAIRLFTSLSSGLQPHIIAEEYYESLLNAFKHLSLN